MTYVNGVDVASYQPNDFPTKGIAFAFVKVSQGTGYTNPKCDAQIADAIKGQCVVGLYHFLQPGDSVANQVAYFKSRDKVKPGYIVAVDWESLNGAWTSSADKDAFIKALKAAYPHNRVGLYTNVDGWTHHDTSSYCGDFLWIADITIPGKPRIRHSWTFHQYGQNAEGDLDVGNFQSQAELKVWAGYPATIPPTVTAVPQAYRDVMLADVFPLPAGHADADGNGAWSLQTVIGQLYSNVETLTKTVEDLAAKLTAALNDAAGGASK